MASRTIGLLVGAALLAQGFMSLRADTLAAEMLPGEGKTVQPISTGRADQNFQNFVVQIGLEQLGYTVKLPLEAQYPAMHLALGQGDADYASVHWDPLHESYFNKAGGDDTLVRLGSLVEGAIQGYLVDKKTADANGLTNLDQFKNPESAKLFDTDGDGKANLTGCNPGWGCERVIEHQLDAFGLRDQVNHNQGEYFALMADTITRYKEGQPILFYTWTPLWVTAVLKPGQDVTWLDVPFSSLPDVGRNADTGLPDGHNTGFNVNTIRVLANKKFIEENPAAKRFFELAKLPIGDVNAAILKVYEGEKSLDDTRRHAEEWIANHQVEFDDWIQQAKKAAAQ
jgi:glycine betaine/proline transport system substrate-binding protein